MLCAVSVHSRAAWRRAYSTAEQQLEEILSSEQTLSGEKMLATTLFRVSTDDTRALNASRRR